MRPVLWNPEAARGMLSRPRTEVCTVDHWLFLWEQTLAIAAFILMGVQSGVRVSKVFLWMPGEIHKANVFTTKVNWLFWYFIYMWPHFYSLWKFYKIIVASIVRDLQRSSFTRVGQIHLPTLRDLLKSIWLITNRVRTRTQAYDSHSNVSSAVTHSVIHDKFL